MAIQDMARAVKQAAAKFRRSTSAQRNAALSAIATELRAQSAAILAANAEDLAAAKAANLSDALVDRLELTPARIEAMAVGVEQIAAQEEVVGKIVKEHRRADGLLVQQQRIPIGVMAMIFESRPNVVIDCSALAIKSGNAMLLKGGKEAKASNAILAEIVRTAIAAHIPADVIALIDSTDRQAVMDMLSLIDDIDVVIPRGGEGLISMVYEHAKMPVIAHFKGLCHVYVHADADLDQALKICLNAKAQRPGVCNAAETILVHQATAASLLPKLVDLLNQAEIEVRGCDQTQVIAPKTKAASEQDWDTEYLDRIVSIRVVGDLDQALDHIADHGSQHTEVIIAKDPQAIEQFRLAVDASCIGVNASSRFNDGGELGLGAELGISTTKFHAYGPMGAEAMTTVRYLVTGDGHIRN